MADYNDVINVNWSSLEEAGQSIIDFAENNIKNKLDEIQELRKQVNWEGSEAEAAFAGYDEFMEEMRKIYIGISQYGKFLLAAAGKYQDTSSKLTNTFETEVYQRSA